MDAGMLHVAIERIAPIIGVKCGSAEDRKTWQIEFAASATPAQRAAAQAALASFDPAAAQAEAAAREREAIARDEWLRTAKEAHEDLKAQLEALRDEIAMLKTRVKKGGGRSPTR